MATLEQDVICIVGPTASGKSTLAQAIALNVDGEVISADSMQVYRGMDIGTGKVPLNERKVPHHGIDLVDPGEPYSVALYQDYARECFNDLASRNKRSILAGGTGLYMRAAIDDYQFPQGDQINNEVRDRYTAYAQEHGSLALWDLLNKKDPASASLIHPNNTRRVIRAFELLEEGLSYAEQREKLATLPQKIPACFIGLSVDSDILRDRINQRVDHMIKLGLVDEVKSLLDNGFRDAITSAQAIGYKEIVTFLDGLCSLDEAIENIKSATRQYAKRQRTWFQRDKRITWIDANESLESMTAQAMKCVT